MRSNPSDTMLQFVANISQFIDVACRVCPLLAILLTATALAESPDDFAHRIVPILKKHCVECHGDTEAKGGFSINNRDAFLDQGYVVANDPQASYLLDLLVSTDPEIQMPPPAKPRLTASEVGEIRKWIENGVPWEDGFTFAVNVYEPPLFPQRVNLPPAKEGREHPVDRILDQYLAEHQLPTPKPIDDATFFRRVSLDLIGLLPTPEELQQFVDNPNPVKRQQLVHDLLDRDIDYADHWMTFWNDLLRNDYTGTGFITGGRTQISRWLYDALLWNKPYDQFTRELIAPPTPDSRGFIDGIKWRGEVSAGQTVEIQFSQSIAQSFLGINMKCASCHDSFIDRWKLEEAYGLAAIYATRELMMHRCDKPTGETATPAWLFPELGQIDPKAPQPERLKQLAALMTDPQNGRFSRTIVNRLWAQMMGRGIVHPLDAMQSEPWNADLLDYLATYLSDHEYNLKAVLKHIVTSEAYQSRVEVLSQDSLDSQYFYRGPRAKRMTAEQFIDSVWQITGAAPQKIDAPVFRAKVSMEEAAQAKLQGKWIWRSPAIDSPPDAGKATAPTNLPAPPPAAGETVLIRKKLELEAEVTYGGAAVTCDNEFILFINGKEVDRGANWQQVRSIPLQHVLKKGHNEIVALVTNAGSGPNPAGFYFESRLQLMNDQDLEIVSDASWEWNANLPNPRSGRLGKTTNDWKPVQIVDELVVWKEQTELQIISIVNASAFGQTPMVRSSLINNDFLMRSLGRPLREQIVSSRPSELTTLEAIDLTNGETLANAIQIGAENLSRREWSSQSEFVNYLYRFALGRLPTTQEMTVIDHVLDAPLKPTQVEDLLWSIMMMPEFLLIR